MGSCPVCIGQVSAAAPDLKDGCGQLPFVYRTRVGTCPLLHLLYRTGMNSCPMCTRQVWAAAPCLSYLYLKKVLTSSVCWHALCSVHLQAIFLQRIISAIWKATGGGEVLPTLLHYSHILDPLQQPGLILWYFAQDFRGCDGLQIFFRDS